MAKIPPRCGFVCALVVGAVAVTLLVPMFYKTVSPKPVYNAPAAPPKRDRLMMVDAGAVRQAHGGANRDSVKLEVVPFSDGSTGFVHLRANETIDNCQEYYPREGADQTPARKSTAQWNRSGLAVLAGEVWRQDGSTWLKYWRDAGGLIERQRFTAGPGSQLFLVERIAGEGKPRLSEPLPKHLPTDDNQRQNNQRKLLPAFKPPPQPSGKMPSPKVDPNKKTSPTRTKDCVYYRANGKKWTHLAWRWEEGAWWGNSYRDGYWYSTPTLLELFRPQDETRALTIAEEWNRIVVTHYRSDGDTVAFTQRWVRDYNSETQISWRLASVDEYDLKGKIRRTLEFKDQEQLVLLVAVQAPQAKGSRVYKLAAKPQDNPKLIESFGEGSIYRKGSWVKAELKRSLSIAAVESVIEPDGRSVEPDARACAAATFGIDMKMLKFPEKEAWYVEFKAVREQFEREDVSFLGERNDIDPCRWYLREHPVDED